MCFACWVRIEMEVAVRWGHNELTAAKVAQDEIDKFLGFYGRC